MSAGGRVGAVAALVSGTIAWLVAAAAYAIVLVGRQVRGDFFCGDRPRGSSAYGQASWQWWFPGTRCTFPASDGLPALVRHPAAWSGVGAVVLVLCPIVLVTLAVRLSRSS